MNSPRSGIALRPELAKSGWLNTMTGKSLKKIETGRGRESAYVGKEEVQERIWFI
jgi:hypothetical protein